MTIYVAFTREEIVFDALLRWYTHQPREVDEGMLEKVVHAIRFPIMPSKYLANTVEPSVIAEHCTAMKYLLFEAYRHQAGRRTGVSAAPLTESGPHLRLKERGREFMIFGTDQDKRCGIIETPVSPDSLLHHVQQLYKKDSTYWLPLETDETFVCIRFERTFRVTSVKFRNRHSRSFCVSFAAPKSGVRGAWDEIVSWTPSSPHRQTKECRFSPAPTARWVRIQLTRWPQSSFSPSLFWLEIHGKEA